MYIDLHNHTNFSFLDGLSPIDKLVARAKELGMNALAITDHGTMHGYLDFYTKCKEAGIKPIIGCEVYVTKDNTIKEKKQLDKLVAEDPSWAAFGATRTDKRGKVKVEWSKGCHLVLLAKDNEGMKNLFRLVSAAATDGFYYKPLADMALLKKYGKGIIALSACLGGEIPQLVMKGKYEEARDLALQYKEIFDEFYLEIQPSKIEDQVKVNEALCQMSIETGIPLICTSDSHYVRAEDWETHDILLAIQMQKTLDDPDRLRFPDKINYLHSEQEMLDAGMPIEAIQNTVKVAEQCNISVETDVLRAPLFPDTKDADADLANVCTNELMTKYFLNDIDIEEYSKRLEYELNVIRDKKLSDYFLIVRDYIQEAKRRGVFVGPGRGSGAGSLVSHLAGITKLDPVKHGLFFERFLNPERKSYPDIDLDFDKERRGEVIDYIMEKYGKDRVCHVGTYSVLGPKSAIKDVARVLGIPASEANMITSMLPDVTKKSIKELLEDEDVDQKLVQVAEQYKRLFDLASQFEGVPRQTGVAASAVIISPVPLTDVLPVLLGTDNAGAEGDEGSGEKVVCAQMDTAQIESMGFIKFDILGLRTLSVIRDALQQAEKIENRKIEIWDEIDAADYKDELTYRGLAQGDCDGVFQLESGGMRQIVKDLRIRDFQALTATVALYRPGPMALIPQYIERYIGAAAPEYLVPELEDILRETFGIIVYQEQVMSIAIKLAGYTAGQADTLRKAMGKKKKSIMDEQKDILVRGNKRTDEERADVKEKEILGFVKSGLDESTSVELAELIGAFCEYAFNKAHAASYAVISYATAWLKAHYPKEYMAALLTSIVLEGGKKKDNLKGYVDHFKTKGYSVLPPDINRSNFEFTVEGRAVRFGLACIRDFGASVKDIVLNNKPYKDLDDFVSKCCTSSAEYKAITIKTINALIFSGALDSLAPGMDRQQIYAYIKQKRSGEEFDIENDSIALGKEKYTLDMPNVLSTLEELYIGMPMTLDPLLRFVDEPVLATARYKTESIMHGVLLNFKKVKTKAGADMAFLSIRFACGTFDVAMFGDAVAKYEDKLQKNSVYRFVVYKQYRNGTDSYSVNKVMRSL